MKGKKKTYFFLFPCFARKYHLSADYDIVSCCHCGLVYQDFDTNQSDYDYYYTHSNKYSNVPQKTITNNYITLSTNLIKNNAPKDSKILDIGAGCGHVLADLKESGYENLFALDPSEQSLAVIKSLGLNGILGNIYEIQEDCLKSFDVIISTGCFEHFLEPRIALECMSAYLKKDGLLCVCVPDISFLSTSEFPFYGVFHHEHINQFTRNSFQSFMAQFNYQEIDYDHVIHKENAESLYAAIYKNVAVLNRGKELVADENISFLVEKYIEKEKKRIHQSCVIIDELVKNEKNFVIWGVGTVVEHLGKISNLAQGNILAVVDNNTTKQGNYIYGCQIQSPTCLNEIQQDYTILICNSAISSVNAIKKEIEKNNWGSEVIHFL